MSSSPRTRTRRPRRLNDGSDVGDTVDVAKGAGSLPDVVKKGGKTLKKLGKMLLWTAPLILAGLEIRHEIHDQAHKRRMADNEYEKAHLEVQLQLAKDGKSVEFKATNEPQGEPPRAESSAAVPAVISETPAIPNPRRSRRERNLLLPTDRSLSRLERRIARQYRRDSDLIPVFRRETTVIRKRRVRRAQSPRDSLVPREGSWTESIREDFRSQSFD